MGQEQSNSNNPSNINNSSNSRNTLPPKPILKQTTINVQPKPREKLVMEEMNTSINDMNPHKLQINKGINSYYNFNANDTIQKSSIPKLYESSKDDYRFKGNLEDEYARQLMNRNLSTPDRVQVFHEAPSHEPKQFNPYSNPNPNKPVNHLGQPQFVAGQLYVPKQDSHVELNREDIYIPPSNNALPSINTRDGTIAPEAPSFTYIPPQQNQLLQPEIQRNHSHSNTSQLPLPSFTPQSPTNNIYREYTNSFKRESSPEIENNEMVISPVSISSLSGFNQIEKQLLVSKGISSLDIDPFGLLNKNNSITLSKLYECYKKLRLLNHPDKGGDSDNFNKIIKCMKKIEEIEKMKISDKQFDSLKSDFKRDAEKYEQNYVPELNQSTNSNGSNNFNKKFNQYFEQNKFTGEFEDGYGNSMDKGPYQKDIEVKNTLGAFDRSNFNNVFTKSKHKSNNKIVVYKVPEPIYSGGDNARSLVNKEGNYTQHGQFTDYMEAFTDSNVLIDTEQIPVHQEESLEIAMKKHKNASLALSDEQVRAIESYENNKKKSENNELNYYNQFLRDADKYHSQMKTITFNPPQSTR